MVLLPLPGPRSPPTSGITQAMQQRPPDISINQSWSNLSIQSLNLLEATVLDPPPLVRGDKPGETGGKVTCSATERPGARNVAVALSPPSFPSFSPLPTPFSWYPRVFSLCPPGTCRRTKPLGGPYSGRYRIFPPCENSPPYRKLPPKDKIREGASRKQSGNCAIFLMRRIGAIPAVSLIAHGPKITRFKREINRLRDTIARLASQEARR